MPDRLKLPPERDFGFYQRRKHDKWRQVAPPDPALEAAVADSHAHVHMLPDPAWELARCAANGVDFVCEILDPSEDNLGVLDSLDEWAESARGAFWGDFERLERQVSENLPQKSVSTQIRDENRPISRLDSGKSSVSVVGSGQTTGFFADKCDFVAQNGKSRAFPGEKSTISVRIAVGVHPHNARLYSDALETSLLDCLRNPRVVAVGEVGLDYYYDISPRDAQREVFRRQVLIAQELDLPIALHLRDGQDPNNPADDAHAEAFGILREQDALGPSTLVHCCTMSPDQIRPWIEADCYIAYGGALTFKNSDAAREGARLVPANRMLFETDAPYMTPEPMRGAACTPAHVVFTAASLAETLGHAPGNARKEFLQQVHTNTLAFYRVADQLGTVPF